MKGRKTRQDKETEREQMYVIVCMVAVLESFIVTTGETIPSEAIPKEASNYYEMT